MSERDPTEPHGEQDDMLARVGQLTRTLHDSLAALGLDKLIVRAADEIPDARDRLDYVARMTEQAAQRVLNATDAASPLQDEISAGARELEQDWKATLSQPFSEARYREMAGVTVAWAAMSRDASDATKQHLMDIMMAQDFQDLTGQVIKKVIALAHDLEQQLVQLLVDYAPADLRREATPTLLNGPQINPVGSDVVADQGQVDDLLESLGF